MPEFDPTPDAISALQTKTNLQRHAIARILKPDGPSLEVLRWIVAQPDCHAATAAMIFWRLLCLAPATQSRVSVLELIVTKFRTNQYPANEIAWDGTEAWRRTALIGAKPAVNWNPGEIPAQCFGPFTGEAPEPATHALFEVPYEEDDAFDSMWCVNPMLAAATDWLHGKPAEVWMAAVDELYASHPNELYLWMVQQPECPAPVAGQIFWLRDPVWYSRVMLSGPDGPPKGSFAEAYSLLAPILDRWRTTGFAPAGFDFSRFAVPAKYRAVLSEFPAKQDPLQIPPDLLDPAPGPRPVPPPICDDFDFWCVKRGLAGGVPRPRSAAVKEWNASLKPPPPEPQRAWHWRDLFRR